MTARILSNIMTPMIERLAVVSAPANEVAPRYIAEGREVVAASGRRMKPQAAREHLALLVEDALAVREDITAEADTIMIGDLIRAIRGAERGDPLPPAAVARAA